MAGVVSRRGRFCRIGLATVCRQSEGQEEEKVSALRNECRWVDA